jgi:arsenate reductase/ArsR family transcriptional regulator
MTLLQQAGLVERRKEGRWHFYRLAENRVPKAAERALAWVTESLAEDPKIREDQRGLIEIRRQALAELSICYRS